MKRIVFVFLALAIFTADAYALTAAQRYLMVAQGPAGSPPDAPVVSSVSNSPAQITTTWGAVTGATSYNLYYRVGAAPTTSTYDGLITGAVSPHTIFSGLTESTTYHVGITALNGSGASALSNTMSAAAAAEPTPAYAYGFEDELTTGLVAGAGSAGVSPVGAHSGSYKGYSAEDGVPDTYYLRYSKSISPTSLTGHSVWLEGPPSEFFSTDRIYRIKKGAETVASGLLPVDSGWTKVTFSFSSTSTEDLTIETQTLQYLIDEEGPVYGYESGISIDDITIY